MYFWNSYPFVRLSIVFICGVLVHDSYPLLWRFSPLLLLSIIALSALSLIISQRIGFYKLRHFNGFILLILFFAIGGQIANQAYHQQSKTHYSNFNGRVQGFAGQVVSVVNERTNHYRYDFALSEIFSMDSSFLSAGIIHLYIRKDSSSISLNYGDNIIARGSFFEVSAPGNPSEFDYKKYLRRQNIFSHAFIHGHELKIVSSSPPNPIYTYAFQFQEKALAIIDKNIVEPRENGIAKALLLGIKDHLDNEVKRSYSAAGAMHVLAVSGLHVGVIYLFLQYIFGRLRSTAIGGKVFGILSIIVIWAYAIVTGLSPSVLRAATMFSIMALSTIQSRQGNIYNTLGVAAFALLLFDPYLIYSVGFQLSFAAVFGIVYLQPKIYQLFDFRIWIVDKAWAITSVSIAAQVATFPISAFYFHQFPTYFLISNLVVIPAATVMLLGGILMLVVDFISSGLGLFIGMLLSKFIWLVNESISLVEGLPNSLLDWIYMDQLSLIMIYAIILTFIWSLHHCSFNTLLISTTLFVGLQAVKIKNLRDQQGVESITLYEMNGKTAIDYIQGHDATLFVNQLEADDLELLSFQINPNRLSKGLRPVSETIIEFSKSNNFRKMDFYLAGQVGSKRILILDSTTFHLRFNEQVSTDLLVIENEAVKSLEWLNSNFSYDHLILGNKNSTFFIRKIEKQADRLDQKIHSLKTDGAFSLNL